MNLDKRPSLPSVAVAGVAIVFLAGCGTTADYWTLEPSKDGISREEMTIESQPNGGSRGSERDRGLAPLLDLNPDGPFVDTRISVSPVDGELVFSQPSGERSYMNVYRWKPDDGEESEPEDVTQDLDRINVEPTFDPQGEYIYYASNYPNAGEWRLWRFDLVDRSRTQITDDGVPARVDTDPTLSPDGRRIAYTAYSRDDGIPQIVVANADGSDRDEKAVGHSPVWSPNGGLIAYVRTESDSGLDRIMILDVESGNTQTLTRGDYNDRHPSWSPDGDHIVFSSNRVTDEDGVRSFDIWQMDASGRSARPLTSSTFHDIRPAVSPEGNRILFVSNRGSGSGGRNTWRIWEIER